MTVKNKNMSMGIHAFIALCILSACSAEAQPSEEKESAKYDRLADIHPFTVFMKDGGWCWYQDPRAIVHDKKLFIGSVKGNGSGPALIGIYDLENNGQLGSFVAQDDFDRDDHNSPVFYVRKDGGVLAAYARHNSQYHYFRISNPNDPLQWSEEFTRELNSPNPKDRIAYMNLYALEDEGLLYNFYRCINFNPTFVTSADDGSTWSEPEHFFASEVSGRNRPYARYASNGKDTIYVSITDAHPRVYGNSIYYFEFRDGKFYRADGSLIKELKKGGPLLPSEAELIYKGSMTKEKPEGFESVPGASWTSAIEIDKSGRPHVGYSLYLSNNDHRYRLASWDGKKWIDREIAFAGKCLYTKESSYTGLVTMDPLDPTVVFISTDVDPTTGQDKGAKHEIYRATIGPKDDINTIKWKAATRHSPVCNIRPKVLRNENQRIVLWQRGDFRTYLNYDLDVVGFIEKVY